ncbi:hypothetical protein DB313_05970 (plasmid) [Borrelia turcica IST7]|uniref:Immunogenic protein P37 n=1 Tax=Borrelia turcica IST7 TaxID=1104446 RepID=A0A386PPJ2_9SPIR|nr:hypothetical protein [Borrelia turcica]AYE37048.1 hypothetical protein DB313_05970 [Borrelia turcica IST7]
MREQHRSEANYSSIYYYNNIKQAKSALESAERMLKSAKEDQEKLITQMKQVDKEFAKLE